MTRLHSTRPWAGAGALACVLALLFGAVASAEVLIDTNGRTVKWTVLSENDGATLSVVRSGTRAACGFVYQTFPRGQTPVFSVFDDAGELRPDGSYNWRLEVLPVVDPELRERMLRARKTGEDAALMCELEAQGAIRSEVAEGQFLILRGEVMLPVDEPEPEGKARPTGRDVTLPTVPGLVGGTGLATRDQLIYDDLIVTGSLCVGFDCVNGEDFGYSTIKVKENNLRIEFDDTSTLSSYPRNDWQLTANESANGGLSKFSIDDISGSRTPFTIEANAPSHSLYVDDYGRVGLGTSTPYVELHAKDGDTPTVRLDQDGSSGFASQVWDLAGNETNFFIRDVTNGSKLSFRIFPGAPSNSLFVASDGDVGVGTASPDAPLHVYRPDGTASLYVEDTGSSDPLEMLVLENAGKPRLVLDNTDDTDGRWFFGLNNNSEFVISLFGSTGNELRVDQSGNLYTLGSVNPPSDARLKRGVTPVDGLAVLETLAAMPITSWSYHWEDPAVRHIGPMAQDFHAAFGYGPAATSIATVDADGVALAAIQGLHRLVRDKNARIAELEARLQALERVVSSLDAGSGR